jgi:hypothetical protein
MICIQYGCGCVFGFGFGCGCGCGCGSNINKIITTVAVMLSAMQRQKIRSVLGDACMNVRVLVLQHRRMHECEGTGTLTYFEVDIIPWSARWHPDS